MQTDFCFVLRTLKRLLGFVVLCFQNTSHPQTGVYAGILTLIAFRFHTPMPWALALLSAATFACITWSIMSYNSWIDRTHDRKKGKVFASKHSPELIKYWIGLSLLTATLLAIVARLSLQVALFCAGIWVLGLTYSHIPRWFFWQNAVVAICSASPALVGLVHTRQPNSNELSVFGALFFIVLTREVYLDMQDQKIDYDNKRTLPVVLGQPCATFHLLSVTYGWTLCLLLYPDWKIRILSVAGAATQFIHARLFFQPSHSVLCKRILDWVIVLLLLGVLLTQ